MKDKIKKYWFILPSFLLLCVLLFSLFSPHGDVVYDVPDSRLETAAVDNPESKAWLTIPDSHIDASVQQGPDNNYYLRRDEEGNYDFHGCLFADYECNLTSINDLSDNTIIYGHTYPNGEYLDGFYDLKRYTEEDFAKEHPYIYLSLPDGKTVWKVVSAGLADVSLDYDCILSDLTEEEMKTVIEKALERSVLDFGTSISEDDHLMTLSTCTGNSDFRMVVTAKLIEKSEVE